MSRKLAVGGRGPAELLGPPVGSLNLAENSVGADAGVAAGVGPRGTAAVEDGGSRFPGVFSASVVLAGCGRRRRVAASSCLRIISSSMSA